MIDTLYHPYFQPPERWLRTMLLFYDKVYSIVPERAKYIPNPGIAALRDKTDGAFVPLTPTKEDLELDEQHYRPLQDVLRELSGWDKARRRRVSVHHDRTHEGSHLRVKGFEIHSDKLAWALKGDLIHLGLAERTADPDWLRVNPQAASLIISLLADRMVINRPEIASTSSDQAPSFAVAAKCELERDRQWTTEATLASAILDIAVPADLAHLPMDRYLEIRKRYEDKREAFRLAMHELRVLYFQRSFQNPEDFHSQVALVVEAFGREMQEVHEGRFGRQVHKWAPIGVGGVAAIGAAALTDPIVSIAAAGVGLTIQVLQAHRDKPASITYKAQTQANLIELGRDVGRNRRWLGRVFS